MWQYHDYETKATDALKLAALELHIAEVTLEIGPNVSMDSASRDNTSLVSYLGDLRKRRSELASSREGMTAGGVSKVRFNRP